MLWPPSGGSPLRLGGDWLREGVTSEGRGDGTTSTICLPADPLPDGTAEAGAEHQHPRPGPGWLQPLVSSISPRTRTLHTPHASSPTPRQRCMEKAQASPGKTVGAYCLGDWAWGQHTCASFPSLGGRAAEDQTDVTRQGHSTVGPGTRPPRPQAPLSPGGACGPHRTSLRVSACSQQEATGKGLSLHGSHGLPLPVASQAGTEGEGRLRARSNTAPSSYQPGGRLSSTREEIPRLVSAAPTHPQPTGASGLCGLDQALGPEPAENK